MAIVTLAEARAQLQLLDTDVSQDVVLQAYCDAITPMIEEKANEVIDQRTIVEEHDLSDSQGWPTYSPTQWTYTLWLRQRPVISVTSITNANSGFAYTAGNLHVRPDGRLRVMGGTGLYGYVTVTYVAGYATVPLNYKQAALIILQHNWESRRGVGNVPGGVMGIGEQITPAGFSIPPKAYEWLGPPKPGGP